MKEVQTSEEDVQRVPFLNLPELYERHRAEFDESIASVCKRAAFIQGAEVQSFEAEYSKWLGTGASTVGCANGTDAITLAAKALELPKGSEAIVPAMTFAASVSALLHAGLKVRLVDVDPDTYLLDPETVEKNLTPQTRLIVPVHLYGQMVNMTGLAEVAKRSDLKILEDAAQAHGATWKNEGVGTHSDIATFSFFPGKNLGAFGDAGAIVAKDQSLLTTCRALGNQGGIVKYAHDYVGYNSRLDTLQAAVLRVKLKYIDEWNEKRRMIAAAYSEMLQKQEQVKLPTIASDAKSVFHLYVIQVSDRESLKQFLASRGIESGIHYPRAIHHQKAFKDAVEANQGFPISEKIAAHCLSLPMCPTLSLDQVQYVAESISQFYS